MMKSDTERAIEMLRIAASYIRGGSDNDRLVIYDGAECDGGCVADDCEFAAAALIEAAGRVAEQNKVKTAT